MRPHPQFLDKSNEYWAYVRTLSETIGYSIPRTGLVKAPTFDEMLGAMQKLTLDPSDLLGPDGTSPSIFAESLLGYFTYRAHVLNSHVRSHLQNLEQADAMYQRLSESIPSTRPTPMNKQRGDKATVAYMTAMVNMLIEANTKGLDFDHDPKQLTTITQNGKPVRTLARRVDGAFPSVVNPVAVWEIKEYYHTTSFGSRVAGGVYETLLDGMELRELRHETLIHVDHLLIVDAYDTWWGKGKSYLCRMVDSLHMGLVDEILFGREIADRLPRLAREWARKVRAWHGLGPDAPRLAEEVADGAGDDDE